MCTKNLPKLATLGRRSLRSITATFDYFSHCLADTDVVLALTDKPAHCTINVHHRMDQNCIIFLCKLKFEKNSGIIATHFVLNNLLCVYFTSLTNCRGNIIILVNVLIAGFKISVQKPVRPSMTEHVLEIDR